MNKVYGVMLLRRDRRHMLHRVVVRKVTCGILPMRLQNRQISIKGAKPSVNILKEKAGAISG